MTVPRSLLLSCISALELVFGHWEGNGVPLLCARQHTVVMLFRGGALPSWVSFYPSRALSGQLCRYASCNFLSILVFCSETQSNAHLSANEDSALPSYLIR